MELEEYIRDRLQFEIMTRQIDPSVLLDEYSMVKRFSSPRSAVRSALTALAAAGLVSRERRSGTVPQLPATEYKSESISTFTATSNARMRMVVVSLERLPATAEIAADLNVEPGEPVTYLIRTTYIDDTAMTIWHIWSPLDLAAAFPRGIPENKTWYELVGMVTGEAVFSVQRDSMGAWATEHDADQLNVEVGSPVTFYARLTTTSAGRPVDRSFSRNNPVSMVTSEQLTVRIALA